MRLWHKDLIPVLPKDQLVSQWRELSALAGGIQKNGKTNHILINFVMDYPYDHFISYAKLIREEMTRRGYRTMDSVWDKIVALKPDYTKVPAADIYKKKMDDVYLEICFYNLLEKYLCGGVPEEFYRKIFNLCNETLGWEMR